MEQKEISTNTLRNWLDTGKKVNVLDIRSEQEREEWHIPGSIHADIYEAVKSRDPEAIKSVDLNRAIPVVTVCASGKTSQIASEMLQEAGFQACNLRGGMKSWSLAWNTASASFGDFDVIQFRRTGKGCLSYLIHSGKEAMIIDASLPVEVYQNAIAIRSLSIKLIADTHIHADHLSRSNELANGYGLLPSVPLNDKLSYSFQSIQDGDTFTLGKVEIKAIHTPGHTMESSSYLIDDKVLLTGDTLFLNAVGRPDLKSDEKEVKHRARLLYRSLKKLLGLDPSVLMLPGHTSLPVPFDREMIQARLEDILPNIPLLTQKEQVFVESLLKRIPIPPANYQKIVEKNLSGNHSDIDLIDLEAGANRCAIA